MFFLGNLYLWGFAWCEVKMRLGRNVRLEKVYISATRSCKTLDNSNSQFSNSYNTPTLTRKLQWVLYRLKYAFHLYFHLLTFFPYRMYGNIGKWQEIFIRNLPFFYFYSNLRDFNQAPIIIQHLCRKGELKKYHRASSNLNTHKCALPNIYQIVPQNGFK